MTFRRACIVCLMAVLTLLPVAAARAAGPVGGAEGAIDRGLDFMLKGKYEEALKEFLDAYDVAPGPRTTAEIGLAEQSLQRWVDAEIHLMEALTASGDKWVQKNRRVLDECLATVRKHIGKLEVQLTPGGPATAQLKLNGELVGLLPLLRPLTRPIGRALIEISAPGYLTDHRGTEIEAGKMLRLVITLEPVPSLPGTPAAQRPVPPPSIAPAVPLGPPPAARARPLTWRTPVGIGAALTGVAAGLLGAYLIHVDGQAACGTPPCRNLRDTRVAGLLSLAGGALGVGAGFGLVLSDPPR